MRTLPLTRQEARLLVLVLERAPKYWFKPADQLPVEDQLFHLYEKLHLFSDSPEVGE
jgi:hypothetical protein